MVEELLFLDFEILLLGPASMSNIVVDPVKKLRLTELLPW